VPLGLPGAGQIRRYALCLFRDPEHTYLYARVLDEKTEIKLATIPLGTCVMVADPQVTVDSNNLLHVLFMSKPNLYAHATINTQGRIDKVAWHKASSGDRPQLIVQQDKSIGVLGGTAFDPAASEAAAPKMRSIKDKPPGL
jgi:hypothetical protein